MGRGVYVVTRQLLRPKQQASVNNTTVPSCLAVLERSRLGETNEGERSSDGHSYLTTHSVVSNHAYTLMGSYALKRWVLVWFALLVQVPEALMCVKEGVCWGFEGGEEGREDERVVKRGGGRREKETQCVGGVLC